MRRWYVWFVILLAAVLVLPLGNVRLLALLIVLGFAVAVAYAARADLLDRGAPDWAWMVVGVVSFALTPFGGFVLWMLARLKWRARPPGRNGGGVPEAIDADSVVSASDV